MQEWAEYCKFLLASSVSVQIKIYIKNTDTHQRCISQVPQEKIKIKRRAPHLVFKSKSMLD